MWEGDPSSSTFLKANMRTLKPIPITVFDFYQISVWVSWFGLSQLSIATTRTKLPVTEPRYLPSQSDETHKLSVWLRSGEEKGRAIVHSSLKDYHGQWVGRYGAWIVRRTSHWVSALRCFSLWMHWFLSRHSFTPKLTTGEPQSISARNLETRFTSKHSYIF